MYHTTSSTVNCCNFTIQKLEGFKPNSKYFSVYHIEMWEYSSEEW